MTSIVIGLAAVVVLILVVVLLALRYLKADDGDDFEDMPEERSNARGSADDRDRRVAGRQPARSVRPPQQARDAEPQRSAVRGQRAARDLDRAGGHDARDHADQRAAAKFDDHRAGESGAKRRQESLPAVRPRPARRAEDGDWPTTKWEQLSDVDYWAEVASDKPLTTTAQPAAQRRPARPGPARDPDARQSGRAGAVPERTAAPRLPVRGARQPAAARVPSAAARAAEFVPAPHVTARAHPESAKRPMAAPGGQPGLAAPGRRDNVPPAPPRPAAVYDDDPLTSPSFPKIPAADSRSYGGGHADTPPSGSRSPAPHAAATQQFAAYASPSGQFDSYGAAGRQSAAQAGGFGQPGGLAAGHASPPPYQAAPAPDPGSYGRRGEQAGLPSRSGGYQAGRLPPASSGPPVAAPSGNPYGSYVSPPASDYPPGPLDSGPSAAYGGHAAGPGAQRENSFSQPPVNGEAAAALGGPVSGWYPDLPAPAGPPAYLDVPGQLPGMAIPAGGYINGNGHVERAGYPGGQDNPAGYLPSGYPAAPHDPAGYAGPDPYGRDPYAGDPYGGYPGYGADG
jgi:hypothetical protein